MANLIESVPCTDSLLVTEMAKFTITDIKDEFVFQNIAPINKPLYWTSYFKAEQESMIIIGNTVFTLTPNEWIFCSCPYISSDGNFKIRFVNEGIYYSKENQLEISTLPSTYVPNIADYSTTVEVSSMIEQTATQIQLSVSETYYNKTQVESLIRIQKDRIDLMVLGQEGTKNILENSSASDWSVYGHTTGVEESVLGEDTCVELTKQDSNPSWYGVLHDEDLLSALNEYREFRFSFDSDCDDIDVFLLLELDTDISFVSPISNGVELIDGIYRHNISFRIVRETSELNFIGLAFKPSETTVKIANLTLFGNTQSIYQELSQTRKDLADNVISYINLSNEGVTISGDKINLIGMVNIINNDSSDGTNISGNKIRTGKIQSNQYSYTSGDYNDFGTFIDLDNSIIRSKYFKSDNNGASFSGTINATGGTFGRVTPFTIGDYGFTAMKKNDVSDTESISTTTSLGTLDMGIEQYRFSLFDSESVNNITSAKVRFRGRIYFQIEHLMYTDNYYDLHQYDWGNDEYDITDNVSYEIVDGVKTYTLALNFNRLGQNMTYQQFFLELIPDQYLLDVYEEITGKPFEPESDGETLRESVSFVRADLDILWEYTSGSYTTYSHIGTDYFRYNNLFIEGGNFEYKGNVKCDAISTRRVTDLMSVKGNVESTNGTWELGYRQHSGFEFIVPKNIKFRISTGVHNVLVYSPDTEQVSINNLVTSYITSNTVTSDNIHCTDLWYTRQHQTSDSKLKTNIETTSVTNALYVVNDIVLRQFDWINDNKHQSIGFVADELEQYGLGLVETDESTGYKGINYSILIPMLTKAIQELSEKVERLERGE